MREEKELKRVLSPRVSRLQKLQTCNFCNRELEKGFDIANYGIIDRQHGTFSRIYFCAEHEDILENLNNEDLPEYHQEYLIDQGFTNEFYRR